MTDDEAYALIHRLLSSDEPAKRTRGIHIALSGGEDSSGSYWYADRGVWPRLLSLLSDKSSSVRLEAINACVTIGKHRNNSTAVVSEASDSLLNIIRSDSDPGVRQVATKAFVANLDLFVPKSGLRSIGEYGVLRAPVSPLPRHVVDALDALAGSPELLPFWCRTQHDEEAVSLALTVGLARHFNSCYGILTREIEAHCHRGNNERPKEWATHALCGIAVCWNSLGTLQRWLARRLLQRAAKCPRGYANYSGAASWSIKEIDRLDGSKTA